MNNCDICDEYEQFEDFLNCSFKTIFYFESWIQWGQKSFIISTIDHNKKSYFDLSPLEKEEIDQCIWQISHYLQTTDITLYFNSSDHICIIVTR